MHKRDNLLYLAPPLVISEVELEEAVAARSARASTRLGRDA